MSIPYSNYPPGTDSNDDYFDMPSVHDDDDHQCVDCGTPELDDDHARCEGCQEVQDEAEREERIRQAWKDYNESDGRVERSSDRDFEYMAACRPR